MVRGDTSQSSTYVTLRLDHRKILATNAPAGGEIVGGGGEWLRGRWGDDVHVVPTPGGSTAPFVMAMRWNHVYDVRLHGGAAGASFTPYQPAATHYLFGTAFTGFKDLPAVPQPRWGYANVYVNDLMDSDGDGLGDELEQELGLCWSTGLGCARQRTDPRDTDRDGIPDGEELLGMRGAAWVDWSLPRWGADPMQKDAFIYVAWRTRTGRDMVPYAGPFSDNIANEMHPARWTDAIASFFRDGPASHLDNPNNEDGLRIHMNMGIPADVPSNERLYGVWSPGERHTLPPQQRIEITEVPEGRIVVGVDDRVPLGFVPSDHFECDRECVADHIALMLVAFGLNVVSEFDSEGDLYRVRADAATPGVDFSVWVATVPECGRGLSLVYEDHGGARSRADDPYYLPVDFRGRVRYVVITGDADGGQASGGRIFSGAGIRVLTHELGHTFGVQHWGHDAWLHMDRNPSSLDIFDHSWTAGHVRARHADINCAPHYLSMMNYAYTHVPGYRFSSEDRYFSVNPASVSETGTWPGMDIGVFDVATTSPAFRFMTTAAGVDWDMSGSVADGRAPRVRAPLRLMTGGNSCQTFSVGRQQLTESEPYGDGAITQIGDHLVAFYVPDDPSNTFNQVSYRVAELGPTIAHGCGGTDDPVDYLTPYVEPQNGCHVWTSERPLVSFGLDVRFVAAYGYGGKDVFVALQSEHGELRVEHFELMTNGILAFQSTQLISSDAHGRPDLSVVYASSNAGVEWSERLVLVYNEEVQIGGTAINLYQGRYLDHDLSFVPWQGFNIRAGATGNPGLLLGPGGVSLAPWPHPYHEIEDVAQDERVTCAIFNGDDNAMHPFCFDPVQLRWVDVADTVWGNLRDDPRRCERWQTFVETAGANGRCIPMTRTPPNLEFRYARNEMGDVYPDGRGNFGLTYHRTTEEHHARLWVATHVARDAPDHPLSVGWSFDHWDTLFYNQWFNQEWEHVSVQQYDTPLWAAPSRSRRGKAGLREISVESSYTPSPAAPSTPQSPLAAISASCGSMCVGGWRMIHKFQYLALLPLFSSGSSSPFHPCPPPRRGLKTHLTKNPKCSDIYTINPFRCSCSLPCSASYSLADAEPTKLTPTPPLWSQTHTT